MDTGFRVKYIPFGFNSIQFGLGLRVQVECMVLIVEGVGCEVVGAARSHRTPSSLTCADSGLQSWV